MKIVTLALVEQANFQIWVPVDNLTDEEKKSILAFMTTEKMTQKEAQKRFGEQFKTFKYGYLKGGNNSAI